MNHNILVIEKRKYREAGSATAITMVKGSPWLYVWVTGKNRKPVYVGETCSNTYNVKERQRYSIGERKSETLNQMKTNYPAVGGNLDSTFYVYCFPLPQRYKDNAARKTMEMWLHWLIVLKHKNSHKNYCGFNYNTPASSFDGAEYRAALKIYGWLKKELSW